MAVNTTPILQYYDNKPYQVMNPTAFMGLPGFGMRTPTGGGPVGGNIDQRLFDGLVQQNVLKPYQAPQMPATAHLGSAMSPQGTQAFNDKLNRLTMNASDALYGGLLGYNPKPIMSPTGNTYNPPNPGQNYNFRNFNFGLLSGMGGQ